MSRYDIARGKKPKVKDSVSGIPELMELRKVGTSKFHYCPHCGKIGFTLIRFGFKQDNLLKRFFNIDGNGRYYTIYKCSSYWGCRRKYYTYVFDNNVWRCIDIVYETRWDCTTGLGRAQLN